MTALSRRGFLALAGSTGLVLTGCQVSDPRVIGGPTAPPAELSSTPAPTLPGQGVALAHEVELASLSRQLRSAADALRLGPAQRAAAGWMAVAHGTHVTALLGRRPTQRPTAAATAEDGWTPRPRPTTTVALELDNGQQAVRTVLERLDRATIDHRSNALGSSGPAALLWGSLAAYAYSAGAGLAAAVPRPEPPAVPVRDLQPWADMEAAQQTLRQVHALVYGYQVAIPWFRGPESESAYGVLVRRRGLRDQLAALLRRHGMIAPAAEPAYALPGRPSDRATAAALLWRMEAAFAPFAGAWLAAATDGDTRRLALETLEEATRLCIDWGGPMTVWPGWPA